MSGMVFHIQRFSLFDGPGVRTVVFLKGCPLRCAWCHNPEGLSSHPQILYDSARCIGCGECRAACSRGQHVFRERLHGFDQEGCIGCGKCAEVCCSGALSLAGQSMSASEVIEAVMRDWPVYRESGGGMTLSGGEPLFQADFAIELLARAKGRGISTCVETSGMADSRKLLEAAAYTDLFYYDYKATGDEMHRKLCGAPQTLILENLKKLDSAGAEVALRCPIVPGANETPEHIWGIAGTARKHKCIGQVQLEPYHRLGISKAEKLGKGGAYDARPPSRQALEAYCRIVEENSGKQCFIA